ncbi:glutaminase liver isoform, mitochondrial-like isoform X2 [Varroa jacobsoni]|uniref:glutaminase liver isoform, mitochondrial-like isoform X2 n=1 Tax=Varroa jacobsoni TaxID=62625 RepID=UPI000BF6098C|nr:glutaminase liver isoform, mitochondrial-like isoform X2 [Varroa jacobsoni]
MSSGHLRRLFDVRRPLRLRPPLARFRRDVHRTASKQTHISPQQDQKATNGKPNAANQHSLPLPNEPTALSLGPQLLLPPSRGTRFASWYNSHGPLQTPGQLPFQTPKFEGTSTAVATSVTSPMTNSHNFYSYGQSQSLTRPFSHANRIFMPEEEFREGKAKALRGDDAPPVNVEDILFDMFKETDDTISVGKFFSALFATGLKKSDHRLKEMMTNLRAVHKEKGGMGSVESLSLDKATFKNVLKENIVLITRALRHQFVIPDFQDFTHYIEDFYWKCKQNTGGNVATYIPQLAKYSPDFWGVSICTVDGQRFSLGDAEVPFTIQSSGKPLNYAIALSELGADTVHQYVGQEPSGRMFNELVLDYNRKPHNPMVNAGAIIIASTLLNLIEPEMRASEKFDWMCQYYRAISGGEYLSFNNAIFLSEREAADRNYAIGYYMKENKCFPEKVNLKDTMDFYFQLCSLEVNSNSVSVMAATLANGGICPITGHQVINPNSCRDVLSLMHSCGMYDYSGQYAFKVGLPAKSGVSGCTMVVIPNVMGLGLWSPPLDNYGNSVRGVQFCEELVRVFSFHHYDNLRHMTQKKDPRRQKYDTKGQKVVNLLFSAASGDVTAMRRHYLSGMNMGLSDYDGRTALHLAAAEGHLEAVEFLLKICGVSPDNKDRWGHTPADDARTFGHSHIVDFLSIWDTANSTDEGESLKNAEVEEKQIAKPDLKEKQLK